MPKKEIGAVWEKDDRCRFTVWAPKAEQCEISLVSQNRKESLQPAGRGYWTVLLEGIPPGTRYLFILDGKTERPDPASHFQPEGVHKSSAVVDHGNFPWTDSEWKGIPLEKMVMYELHTGTFTSKGDFKSVIPRLEELKNLGINALNLMPAAQFPGERNWGYDGVYPFAVQNSYGGPEGLKELVNACHEKSIAVILDVVYNHLGPEGNYLHDYGPYFTSKYRTPWGDAVNFDDAYSDEVRWFFIQNALHWFERYHMDGLRLDAVHAITDMSAEPFLKELAERVKEWSLKRGRKAALIAESDLNDPKIIRPGEKQGYGLDGQWCDDFHHALHALLTGEKSRYYADFGKAGHLAKSFREGYVLTGNYSVFRRRRHGGSARDRPASQFVVFSQNHDQAGNRMYGERLSSLISWEALKLAAGVLICSPYIPLLFMGQEYAETAPFLYFVSHGDPELVRAVRNGRRKEFPEFITQKKFPDPQSEKTFLRSKLNWELSAQGKHRIMREYYRNLLKLKTAIPALADLKHDGLRTEVYEQKKMLVVFRRKKEDQVCLIANFSSRLQRQSIEFPLGLWKKIWDSAQKNWKGPGEVLPDRISGENTVKLTAWSFAVFKREVTG